MKKLIAKLEAFTLASLTGAPLAAFAQGAAPQLPETNVTSPDKVIELLCTIAGWFFTLLIVLAIIFVLVAAFRYLTAQGDPEKVGGANRALIFAAVAVGVAILAKAIPVAVGSFLGVGGIGQC